MKKEHSTITSSRKKKSKTRKSYKVKDIKTLTPFCLEVSEYSKSAPGLFEPFALVEMQFENLTSQSQLMNTIERVVYIAGIAKGSWHQRLIQLYISQSLLKMKRFHQ